MFFGDWGGFFVSVHLSPSKLLRILGACLLFALIVLSYLAVVAVASYIRIRTLHHCTVFYS